MVLGKDGANGDRQTFGMGEENDPCPTIQSAHHHAAAIKQSFGINPQGGQMLPFDKECGETLAIGHQGGVMTEQDISQMKYIVRRLTPIECERLMGLPDGWTIPKNLEVTDALVEEFREKHDTFKRIMAEYENEPMPKPTSAAQVRKWLEKITNADTCPDAPRYKACGNGWATNQPRWILTRLLTAEEVEW
jgi:site-specific DNA-cytosine methylase